MEKASFFDLEKKSDVLFLLWIFSYPALIIFFVFCSALFSHLIIPSNREVYIYNPLLELIFRFFYIVCIIVKSSIIPLCCGGCIFLLGKFFFSKKQIYLYVAFGAFYFMSIYELMLFWHKCGMLDVLQIAFENTIIMLKAILLFFIGIAKVLFGAVEAIAKAIYEAIHFVGQ